MYVSCTWVVIHDCTHPPPMQVWDLKDLGLQATQRIRAASDPLHLLGEVAGAFPTLVEALSRMRVEPGLR